MAELFNLTFPANLSEFTSTVTDGGDLFWDSGNLDGVGGRVGTNIDDATAIYGVKTFTALSSETDLRFRFYQASLAALTMAGGDIHDIGYLRRSSDSDTRCWLTAFNDFGTRKIGVQGRDDGGNFTSQLTAAMSSYVFFEVHLHRATNATSIDGWFKLYGEETLLLTSNNYDNYDTFNFDAVRMGMLGGRDAGTSGIWYYGQMVARNDATPIGAFSSNAPTNTITASGKYFTTSDGPTAVPGCAVADGSSPVTSVVMAADNGAILTFDNTGTSVTFQNNGTSTVTLENGADDTEYSTVLGTMTVQGAADFHEKITITQTSSDGTLEDEDSFYVLNDPRTITATGPYDDLRTLFASLEARLDVGELSDQLTLTVTDDTAMSDTEIATLSAVPVLSNHSVMAGVGSGVMEGVL